MMTTMMIIMMIINKHDEQDGGHDDNVYNDDYDGDNNDVKGLCLIIASMVSRTLTPTDPLHSRQHNSIRLPNTH